MEPIGRLGNVMLPVQDMDAAVRFYEDAVGLPLKFRDGDRFAAFDAGGTTIALAGPDEHPPDGTIALSFKVADVPAAVDRLREAGGTVLRAPEQGPHEQRAAVRDTTGTVLFVYAPTPR